MKKRPASEGRSWTGSASAAASIATRWREPVPGRELHPLKSSAFRGALYRQLRFRLANFCGRFGHYFGSPVKLTGMLVPVCASVDSIRVSNQFYWSLGENPSRQAKAGYQREQDRL